MLAFPEEEGQLIVNMDARDTGLGAVLAQVQGGEEQVIQCLV